MFSRFKLAGIDESFVGKYKSIGKTYYDRTLQSIKTSLDQFKIEDGTIDGSKLQEKWFSTNNKFDVFLSHSHNDEELALAIAGFLNKQLGLNTFIDSFLWGYSDDLLRKIDEFYCMNGEGTYFYYDKRNVSTSHVHMMLSIALSRMMDKCESVFFLNSENSISIEEEINKKATSSPWIYYELSLADIIQIRPVDYFRGASGFFNRKLNLINENIHFKIKYDVTHLLDKFATLDMSDLLNWQNFWQKNSRIYKNALDYIYLKKGIIKNVLNKLDPVIRSPK